MTTAGAQYGRNSARRGNSARARPRRKWLKNLTWRMVVLLAVAGFIVGYPVYLALYSTITGGITHQGDLAIVDLKAMSTFEMDQNHGVTEDIPARFRELNGKRVRLTGQMYAPFVTQGKVNEFTLVYSISNCCFNGPPLVQHFVQANMTENKTATLVDGFVNVTGILHVGVERKQDHIQSVYRVDVDKVQAD